MKVFDIKTIGTWLSIVVLTLITRVASAEEVLLDRVVAIVDDDVIMQTELNARLKFVYQRIQESGTQAPPRDQIIPQILEQLVLERLQLNLGERNGIRIPDTQINQALQQVAQGQGKSFDQFVEEAHQTGTSLTDLRQRLRDEMIINQVQEGAVKRNIRISPQEIDNFLNSEEGQFWKSPELDLGHIQLSLSAGASKERVAQVKEQIDEIYQQLKDGADFRQMAITKSAGQNALQGGNLGWRRAVQLPVELSAAVRDLKPGELTPPVRTDAGFHILKAYGRRGGEQEVMVKQYKVRHILLRVNEIRDDEATFNQLEELRARVQNGEDFAVLAKEFSQDIGSALGGGDLGWSLPGQFVPEFEQMMKSVEVNEVSHPFRSQFGWHMLQVTDTREQDFSGEVMRNQAAEILRNRKFEQELEIWLREQRERTFVEFKVGGETAS